MICENGVGKCGIVQQRGNIAKKEMIRVYPVCSPLILQATLIFSVQFLSTTLDTMCSGTATSNDVDEELIDAINLQTAYVPIISFDFDIFIYKGEYI